MELRVLWEDIPKKQVKKLTKLMVSIYWAPAVLGSALLGEPPIITIIIPILEKTKMRPRKLAQCPSIW